MPGGLETWVGPFIAGIVIALACAVWLLRRRSAETGRHPVSVGDLAPSIDLPTWDGRGRFDLEGERGHFIVLAFLLGDWCPLCHVMLRALLKEAEMLAGHGVQLVAIVPSSGGYSDEVDRRVVVLSDADSRVARTFADIDVSTDIGRATSWPESFLIDPEGVIQFGSRLARDHSARGPREVIELLELVHADLEAAA